MSKKTKTLATTTKVRGDRRALLALLVVPLLLIATWMFFTSPSNTAVAEAESAATVAAAGAAAASTRLTELKAGEGKNSDDLLAKARTLDEQLPNTTDGLAFGTSLTALAASVGVEVASFTPSEVTTAGSATGQQYEVSVTGSRSNVNTFMGRVSQGEQLVTIPRVSYVFSNNDTTVELSLIAWSDPAPYLGAGA